MEEIKNKILVLKGGKEFDIKEFTTNELELKVTLLEMNYDQIATIFTPEQITEVKIVNELGETILTVKDHVLGDRINVNSREHTVELSLQEPEAKQAITNLTKKVDANNTQLSQNQADIDAINEAIASLAEIVGGTAE